MDTYHNFEGYGDNSNQMRFNLQQDFQPQRVEEEEVEGELERKTGNRDVEGEALTLGEA